MDIHERDAGGGEWFERRANAKTLFSKYDKDWSVRLTTEGWGRMFTVLCAVEPAGLEAATLQEQLNWVREDLARTYREIDAIIDDPENWPAQALAELDKTVVERLAARFLSSLSRDERELLRTHTEVFHQEMKALLGR
jgi:3-oxoacyl-ACP reductase-like protein